MCLLIALSRTHEDAPLIVAANRDEWLARPATSCTVLQPSTPRIVGGRDALAGGTWLAVNAHGVFAGLTNRPTLAREPTLRSRGELPLALTQHTSAAAAVDDFTARFRPRDYSPAWLFVGDRTALYVIDMTEGERPHVEALPPGLHVLENRAWHAPSAKATHVRARMAGVERLHGDALRAHLADVLRDHTIPDGHDDSGVAGFVRPRETEACCVHAGPYGTRSSTLVAIPARKDAPPRLWVADGTPCTHAFEEQSDLLTEP